MIPDPTSEKPVDWDDEMDGDWEAPLLENPACKDAPGCGPWTKPTIDNPAFKGKWRAPMIANPAYKVGCRCMSQLAQLVPEKDLS